MLLSVRHADDHIHIVATLATLDGRRVHPHNDYYKARAASHAIERRYGLTSTASADRTAAKRPTRAEIEKLARVQRQRAAEGGPVPRLTDREQLRRHVRVAAAGSRSLPEFWGRLERAGVMVRLRYGEQQPDQVTGYAVALPVRSAVPQPPVWFGGGKLAPDLTLPKLQSRFASADDGGRDTLARGHQRTVGATSGKTSGKTPHPEQANKSEGAPAVPAGAAPRLAARQRRRGPRHPAHSRHGPRRPGQRRRRCLGGGRPPHRRRLCRRGPPRRAAHAGR